MPLPKELELVRERALKALAPMKPADADTNAPKNFVFAATRTEAGRKLAPYYLVYFLLVDFLQFENLGKFEKVSWSIPIDYEGTAFLIEHRKFGCGVFAADLPAQEVHAAEIVKRVNKAVKIAEPYFEWRAKTAADASTLNVLNYARQLFERFDYFRSTYRAREAEAEARKDERHVETRTFENGGTGSTISFPSFALRREATWLALAAIESFFSWTEHIFIHIAILSAKVTTGTEVADLAASDWADKFKLALPIADRDTKLFFDKLVVIRRQLRNAVAHGSFGKQSEAFQFHSSAGAVPLLLPHKRDKNAFRFGSGVDYVDEEALNTIDAFIEHLWSGDRAPAKLYIQDSGLPLILTLAKDGTYARAMVSAEDMDEFLDYLGRQFDQAANMDW
jgi:hypothetical protein